MSKGDSFYFKENADHIVVEFAGIIEVNVDNTALIEAELLALKSFVTKELWSSSRYMDRIRIDCDESTILKKMKIYRTRFQLRI